MSRFPEAVMASVRNRELLAKALDEQEREEQRRNFFFRSLAVSLPIGGVLYALFGSSLPGMENVSFLRGAKKQILEKVGQQIRQGDKVMIGAEQKASAYAQDEGTDEIIRSLEARNEDLKEFVAKAPHKELSEEQAVAMAERAEFGEPRAPASQGNLSAGVDARNQAIESAMAEDEPFTASPPTERSLASRGVDHHPKYEVLRDGDLPARFPELFSHSFGSGQYRTATQADLDWLLSHQPKLPALAKTPQYEPVANSAYPELK